MNFQRKFLNDLAHKMNITSAEGWLQVTSKVMQNNGGSSLVQYYHGSLTKLLSTVLPEYKKMCRDFVESVVHDLKLPSIQHLVDVPLTCPT